MKRLLLYWVLLAAPATTLAATSPPLSQPPPTKVAVSFSRKTTFAQLATIRQDLLTGDGIVLTYDKLEFSSAGELLKIKFRVDYRDGYAGTASSDDLPADYAAGTSFGFVHDYTSAAQTPFRVATL